MRISAAFLTLLLVLLPFVAGCSGGEGEAPAENDSEASAPATDSESSRVPTLNITNSAGERVGVEVEIADNTLERARGLMERTELAKNAGMLFVFDQEQTLPFYMKNTLIPLSIAYIDAGGSIVDIQDMQPLDETPHPSAAPAQYALEVNQGFFTEHSVEVGNKVELPRRSSSVGTPRAEEVIQAFRDAGLEVGETYPVELEPGWDERPVPKSYEEATRFMIPSLGESAGGRVFVFGSDEDLATVRDYYNGFGDSLRPHIYVGDRVLLQINRQLPDAEADKYGAVLEGGEAPSAGVPPVGAPAAEAPPDETPPIEEAPPAVSPPDQTPPAAEAPPGQTPPTETPPIEASPAETPPIEEAPPVGAPG